MINDVKVSNLSIRYNAHDATVMNTAYGTTCYTLTNGEDIFVVEKHPEYADDIYLCQYWYRGIPYFMAYMTMEDFMSDIDDIKLTIIDFE